MTALFVLLLLLVLAGAQVAVVALWAAGSLAAWPWWALPSPLVAALVLLLALSAIGRWRMRRAQSAAFQREIDSVRGW